MLQDIFAAQYAAQKYRGFSFPMKDKQRAEYIKSQTLHCIDELCEMLHEIKGYKEWKLYDYDNNISNKRMDDNAKEELADALHFFVNIAIGLGITAEDLHAAYAEKQRVNYARLNDKANYKLDTEE